MMKGYRIFTSFFVFVVPVVIIAALLCGNTASAQFSPGGTLQVSPSGTDEIRLTNGKVITGKLLSFDGKAFTIQTDDETRIIPKENVSAVFLSGACFQLSACETSAITIPGQPPAGVTCMEGLKFVRWITYHRITNFKRDDTHKSIANAKISADGSKIIFDAYQGVYTINVDGTGLTQLTSTRSDNGLIDISADGKKVAWYEGGYEGLYVANSDSSGKVKMPGGFQISALRMTANGSALVVLSAEKGSIFWIPSDGSDVKKITGVAEVAKVVGADENNNLWSGWPSGLDISDDGTRIVFPYQQTAVAVNSDGSGLRKITNYKYEDGYLYSVRVSGDGKKVSYFYNNNNPVEDRKSNIYIQDWDGGNAAVHRFNSESPSIMMLSQDGSQSVLGWGLRLYDGNGKDWYNALDFGTDLVYRPNHPTISANLKRAVIEIEGLESTDQGRPSQLMVVNFNPSALDGAPSFGDIKITPKFLLTDGSTNATLTVKAQNPDDVEYMGAKLFRKNDAQGTTRYTYYDNLRLNDNGQDGDEKAKDGIYTTNQIRLYVEGAKQVSPGPVLIRVFAKNKAGHILSVEVESIEARTP